MLIQVSYPTLFSKGYHLPKINGISANKTRRDNLLSIATELIVNPEDSKYPTIFSRRYIRQAIRKILPAKHYSTLFYYENYITEFAIQNTCESGYYNLENIVEVILNDCDLADLKKIGVTRTRQKRWYDKIRANAIRAAREAKKELDRLARLLAYQTRKKLRKIKFSCQITADKLLIKFQVVKLETLCKKYEIVNDGNTKNSEMPSVSYRSEREIERDTDRKQVQTDEIKTFSNNTIEKRSFRRPLMSVKASNNPTQ